MKTDVIEMIDCASDVAVRITASVRKMCPVKDEVDVGTLLISYTTNEKTFELHDLRRYLLSFATKHLSHEDFTRLVAEQLDVAAVSTWTTAGMEVSCAVLRESLHADRA